tara:strand:+ start:105 stop:338 length:234 start_codon:yes stop_codon:yes gene_type:complete
MDLEKLFNKFTDNFMTATDIATLLKVKERTIWQYKANEKMPRPFGFIDNKPIWSKKDILKWIKTGNLSQVTHIISIK